MSLKGRLTVIIPTWNRSELLEKCLASLDHQTVRSRVLVVDNGSTDDTGRLCTTRFSHCGYLRLERNFGFARAVNAGINQAETDYIALLNNDTEADANWVKTGLEAFEQYPDYWFFASRMINYFQRDYLDSAGDCYGPTGLPLKRGFGENIEAYPIPEPVLGASAGAAFYRRRLFDEVGLFDEGFSMYLEDVDLSLRAQLKGYQCLYLPEAVVFHMEAASDDVPPTRPSSSEPKPFYSKNRVFWITRNRWQLMITYQPARNIPHLAYGWSKSFLFHLIKGGFTISFLRGLLAGLLLTGRAARKRLRLKKSKVISNQRLCRLLTQC
jgi:GT2 family glycosyltransferase